MNSLVVLLSVMALVAAKPSLYQPGIISYSAPAIAVAQAPISHQSRIDIKSSPAVVATETIAPLSRAVIAEQAVVAAPTAYAAPLAIAPAAYSTQSRIDIKSSPAVVHSVAAAPIAYRAPIAGSVTYSEPLAYNAHIAAPLPYSEAIAGRVAYSTPDASSLVYNAPLAATYTSFYEPAIAPAATILKSADINAVAVAKSAPVQSEEAKLPVAPTETPEVTAARAAHLEAKALEELHQIHKRSVKLVAGSPVVSTYGATPVISGYAASPVVYPSAARIAPVAISTPLISSAYGIHSF